MIRSIDSMEINFRGMLDILELRFGRSSLADSLTMFLAETKEGRDRMQWWVDENKEDENESK